MLTAAQPACPYSTHTHTHTHANESKSVHTSSTVHSLEDDGPEKEVWCCLSRKPQDPVYPCNGLEE